MEEVKPKTAVERRKALAAKERQSHPWRAVFAMIMVILMLAPIVVSLIGTF